VDLLDAEALRQAFAEFQPVHVIHLAARTDLEGVGVEAYTANTTGVENLLAALGAAPSVRRCVFTSTKLVCPNDHAVSSFDDYCPETDYGRSKAASEKIVKQSPPACEWCVVRPTGIWGPWFGVPYRGFFQMVARGRYIHPNGTDAPKSFGYVGNVVFQIEALLAAPREKIHEQTFYLSDYEPYTVADWADTISRTLRGRPVRRMPHAAAWLLAKFGDLLKACGLENPPLTSFRLRNMQADTSRIPLDTLRTITGPLPFDMETGVEQTLDWMRRQNLSAGM
jgi:nucleoside-diphosphate-sugar epimerase